MKITVEKYIAKNGYVKHIAMVVETGGFVLEFLLMPCDQSAA